MSIKEEPVPGGQILRVGRIGKLSGKLTGSGREDGIVKLDQITIG